MSEPPPPAPAPSEPLPSEAVTSEAVLEVDELVVTFATETGPVTAVGPVSFRIGAGETVGLVGESGSGKTVTSLAIMGLLARRRTTLGGRITFAGRELTGMPERKLNRIRGSQLTMIFQEPMSALNPAIKVGEHIAEVLRVHAGVDRRQAREQAVDLMAKVGIPDPRARAREFPHTFSGGMRQRIMIAMALACSPSLMIADEPTTALDVTVQAEILALLRSIQAETGMALLYITHDLDVVAEVCSSVMVMYAGQIVEEGLVKEVFERPRHPYTASLLHSRELDAGDRASFVAPGAPPVPSAFPRGCRFHPRCPFARPGECTDQPIVLEERGERRVRCVLEAIP
jgi:peptide/nickel transport system ATP-binding protein